MPGWVLVAAGGALGAVSRYAVTEFAVRVVGSTVWGTFAANVTGSLLLGLFIGYVGEHTDVPAEYRLLVAVGFLGSYTTFSTLTVATTQLADEGDFLRAGANILGSLAVGVVAAVAGLAIGRAL